MRDKLFRSIAFAVVAAITVGVAPSFANESALGDDTKLLADGMFQQKQMRRVYKRPSVKRVVRRAVSTARPVQRIVRVETTRIIEKPVIIEREVQVQAPAPVVEELTVVQPAVVESATPVIIDRYEKRHRSLIHLGLFPFNLLGE